MSPRVKFSVEKIEGQGVDIQRVVDGLKNLKADLIELGCNVSVKVAGMELEAGNGTRTRDILLGNFKVMAEGEPATSHDPAEWEQCGNCGEFRIRTLPKDKVVEFSSGLIPGAIWFECVDCGHIWYEVIK